MSYEISVTENITLISLNDSPSDIAVTAKIFEFLSKDGIDVDFSDSSARLYSLPFIYGK